MSQRCTGLLDGIHAKVCDSQQTSRIVGIFRKKCDSDGGGDGEIISVEREWPFGGFTDGIAKLLDCLAKMGITSYQGELIASQAGDGAVSLDVFLEIGCDVTKKLISSVMPVSIVDLLESVEIQHEQS